MSTQEAAQSIAFYRSVKQDSKEVLEELDVIRRALNPELDGNVKQFKYSCFNRIQILMKQHLDCSDICFKLTFWDQEDYSWR